MLPSFSVSPCLGSLGRMASKEIAMMLDELMGRNRNSNPDDKQEELTWQSRGVCPYFLVCQI